MSTRGVIAAIAFAAACVLVAATAQYVLVLFGGVLFAVFLHAVAAWPARHTRIPYGVWLATLLLLGAGFTALAVVLLAPTVSEQVSVLGRQLPRVLDDLRHRVDALPLVPSVPDDLGPSSGSEDGPFLGFLGTALGSGIEVGAGIVVVFFIGVYGAAQPKVYRDALAKVPPSAYQQSTIAALDAISTNLARWLLGRVAAMLFVGITSTIAFHVLDVPLALALGVFAGLLTFIEYAGAVISAIPPVLLSLAQDPGKATAVLVLFTLLHMIEGYLLTPLFARVAVRSPPAGTLACQVLLGALVGPLGLTFSTPLLVVCLSGIKAWRESAPDQPTQEGQESVAEQRESIAPCSGDLAAHQPGE